MSGVVCVLWDHSDWGDDGAVRCCCGPDLTGEDIDVRPDCDQHGTTPAALEYQAARLTITDKEPF